MSYAHWQTSDRAGGKRGPAIVVHIHVALSGLDHAETERAARTSRAESAKLSVLREQMYVQSRMLHCQLWRRVGQWGNTNTFLQDIADSLQCRNATARMYQK